MAIRTIITVPDPQLREVSKPVEAVTDDTRALMDDMLETMYDAPGIGLAAIQIGVPLRIIVMDLAGKDEPPAPRFFVNPVISNCSDETTPYEEGCLSIPGYYEEVERPARCVVEFLDYQGTPQRLDADGLFA
ncbi:MAG: peptide deformylase, partial [Pseudomonadota bacterium]